MGVFGAVGEDQIAPEDLRLSGRFAEVVRDECELEIQFFESNPSVTKFCFKLQLAVGGLIQLFNCDGNFAVLSREQRVECLEIVDTRKLSIEPPPDHLRQLGDE